MHRWVVFFLGFLFWPVSDAFAASAGDSIIVHQIQIDGNSQTKEKIIRRELNIEEGERLPPGKVKERLEVNKLLLLNSGLFSDVQISLDSIPGHPDRAVVRIQVTEALYIYPIPVVEFADRNFNIWWVEHKRALDRINFGLFLYHTNLTGQNDFLKVAGQYGYTQKVELEYFFPFLNKRQTLGLYANVLLSRNREVGYATINDRLDFYQAPYRDFLFHRYRMRLGLTYRPKWYVDHRVIFSYQQNRIGAIVASEVNPEFLGDSRTRQRYLSLTYRLTSDKRDRRPYPLAGNLYIFELKKEGVGIFNELNTLELTVKVEKHQPLNRKISLGWITKGQASLLRGQQPYYNYRALGYFEDFLRGYEYYVIDGLDFVYTKFSARYNLWNNKLSFGKLMPVKALRKMPFEGYLVINNDFGYVNDPHFSNFNNTLTNSWLWGGGVALDLVMYYDKVFRFEFNINQFGEKALFFHYSLGF